MSYRCWKLWENYIVDKATPILRGRFEGYAKEMIKLGQEHDLPAGPLYKELLEGVESWPKETIVKESGYVTAKWTKFPQAYKSYAVAYITLLTKGMASMGGGGVPVQLKLGAASDMIYLMYEGVSDRILREESMDDDLSADWKPSRDAVGSGIRDGLRKALARDRVVEAYLDEMTDKKVFGEPKSDVRAIAEAAADAAAAAAEVATAQHEDKMRERDLLPVDDDDDAPFMEEDIDF